MFSKDEKLVITILGSEVMGIVEISKIFYDSLSKHNPVDSNNYIASILRRIIRKCKNKDCSWTIKGKGSGRSGRKVWKESKGDEMRKRLWKQQGKHKLYESSYERDRKGERIFILIEFLSPKIKRKPRRITFESWQAAKKVGWRNGG